MFSPRSVLCLVALLAALLPGLSRADPPARVGRLSHVEGQVTFRTDRQDGGGPASVNWPISSGALLDTERGARAEVWVGATVARLGGDSRLEFSTVDDQLVAMQLAAGSLSLTVRDPEQAKDLEVTTPNGRVQFAGAGRYRIDVGLGRTNVSVHAGNAYVYGADRSLPVSAGRAATIDANGAVALYAEALHDGFDDWAAGRDATTQPRAATRYVSPQMTGYQDLDSYGDWGSVAEYGTVWYPRAVPVGWAPYRYGRWAWVAPWGWTWVDAAPWGFAPFHYGRWLEIRGRWGWVPGTYVARPVYAPALVGWVGSPGWSLSLSVGSTAAVGWFPLAPREVYVPAYRSSPTYIRQVNVTHVTNVTVIDRALADRGEGRFAHRARPEAVTVVPANTLRQGGAITAASLQPQSQRELQQAPVSARAPDAAWVAPPTGERRVHREERDQARAAERPAAVLPPPAAPVSVPDAARRRENERTLERPVPPPVTASSPAQGQSLPPVREADPSPAPGARSERGGRPGDRAPGADRGPQRDERNQARVIEPPAVTLPPPALPAPVPDNPRRRENESVPGRSAPLPAAAGSPVQVQPRPLPAVPAGVPDTTRRRENERTLERPAPPPPATASSPALGQPAPPAREVVPPAVQGPRPERDGRHNDTPPSPARGLSEERFRQPPPAMREAPKVETRPVPTEGRAGSSPVFERPAERRVDRPVVAPSEPPRPRDTMPPVASPQSPQGREAPRREQHQEGHPGSQQKDGKRQEHGTGG